MPKKIDQPKASAKAPVKAPESKDVKKDLKKEKDTEGGAPRSGKNFQSVKGMKDILPHDQPYWEYVRNLIEVIGSDYGFNRIDIPVLEESALFSRGVGKQTDVVEKEMYTFMDKGGEMVAMRPEFTSGVVRAYIEHGMANWPQPVKLYAIGPVFRYDKPQADRFRQLHQVSFEMFGEKNPAVDAQIILMGAKLFRKCGIASVLHINSIGCTSCRGVYKEVLTEYYKNKRAQLCEDCKRRLVKNPLRLLDCKEQGCQPIKQDAPHLVDYLCEECKDHFTKVLEFLDELELPYHLDPFLVRGLDYYNRTVFEFLSPTEGDDKSVALGGGGRYDYLVEELGGRPTPACGFAVGMERIVSRMKELPDDHEIQLKLPRRTVTIFFAQLGEQAKRRAMNLYEDLLNEGFPIAENFAKDSLKSQLESANKMSVKFTLILGQKELLDGTIIIRNMEGGEQEVVDVKKIIPILHKKIDTLIDTMETKGKGGDE